jgi:hypothetical protein
MRTAKRRICRGLVDSNGDDSTASSIWDIETSGLASSAGGSGKTIAEMRTAGTFIEGGTIHGCGGNWRTRNRSRRCSTPPTRFNRIGLSERGRVGYVDPARRVYRGGKEVGPAV